LDLKRASPSAGLAAAFGAEFTEKPKVSSSAATSILIVNLLTKVSGFFDHWITLHIPIVPFDTGKPERFQNINNNCEKKYVPEFKNPTVVRVRIANISCFKLDKMLG
jgi:hypothetical protein